MACVGQRVVHGVEYGTVRWWLASTRTSVHSFPRRGTGSSEPVDDDVARQCCKLISKNQHMHMQHS
jgi:hypothetical protein